MGLFSKKKGGTFFGNLLGKVANVATGGVLGAKRVEALGSGNLASINPTAEVASKGFIQATKDAVALGLNGASSYGLGIGSQTTFAGQAAMYNPNSQTYEMSKSLNEVTIKPDSNPVDALLKVIGDKVSYLGGRATENTKVGLEDNTKWIVGGLGAAAILAYALKK